MVTKPKQTRLQEIEPRVHVDIPTLINDRLHIFIQRSSHNRAAIITITTIVIVINKQHTTTVAQSPANIMPQHRTISTGKKQNSQIVEVASHLLRPNHLPTAVNHTIWKIRIAAAARRNVIALNSSQLLLWISLFRTSFAGFRWSTRIN